MKLDDILIKINQTALNFNETISTQLIGSPFGKNIFVDHLTTESASIASTAKDRRKISSYLGTGFHWSRFQIQVKLSGKNPEKHYKFSVPDDGYGISPQYHHQLSVIFKTLATCISKENTGIRSAMIAKQVVKTARGLITLDSISVTSSNFDFT